MEMEGKTKRMGQAEKREGESERRKTARKKMKIKERKNRSINFSISFSAKNIFPLRISITN